MQDRIVRGNLYLEVAEYTPDLGEYQLPKGLIEALRGENLDEQTDHFAIAVYTEISKYSYGDLVSTRCFTQEQTPWTCSDVHGVVVDNGIIVGLWVKKHLAGEGALFFGNRICTYSASDDDGPGSSDRDDHIELRFYETPLAQ